VIRNEVGVVEYPDGRSYAMAVFTQTRLSGRDAAINAVIGTAAATAVETLIDQNTAEHLPDDPTPQSDQTPVMQSAGRHRHCKVTPTESRETRLAASPGRGYRERCRERQQAGSRS
jgi:beta-lactamase class A